MLDRHYTTDELAIAIKKALRPSNIEDMTEEQLGDLIRELKDKEKDRKQTRNILLFMIAMPIIIATLFDIFYYW